MRKKFSLILLFIFLFSNSLFAQDIRPLISPSLLKKASQSKSAAKMKAAPAQKILTAFYPQNGNSDNVDVSFFKSRGIEYTKSRNFISAKIAPEDVDSLNSIKGVESIELDVKIKALETVSEGRDAVNASVYTYDNIGGSGVKIAVVDIGFMYYSHLAASGELPRNLITKDFTVFGAPPVISEYEYERHGTACAEVVYDFAPQAQMYLLKVDTLASLQNAMDYCKAQDIKIASCSIGFDSGFWCDGTGDYAKIATDAYNGGVLPVFAAGNEAEKSWAGMFNPSSEGWMIFPNGRDYLELNIVAYGSVYMEWDDFTARNKKYTIYMYDIYGTELDSSVWADGSKPSVYVSNGSVYKKVRIKIKKENALENVNIRLYFEGYYASLSDKRSESSLSSPADSREALTVGAVDVKNWNNGPIESYSSWGPTRRPSIVSTPLTQAQKPDITAPTCVTTISYGYRGFNGTSGATPHVAGSAALLLSLDRTMSTAQLKDKVLSYYKSIASSPDNMYGRGKLVLGGDDLPDSTLGEIVCFPNPASISKNGYIKITNLPYNTALIDVNVYTVTGEFVKSFSANDLKSLNGRMTIVWDLKNQSGLNVAPGIYFVTVTTPVSGKKVKKIAIQK